MAVAAPAPKSAAPLSKAPARRASPPPRPPRSGPVAAKAPPAVTISPQNAGPADKGPKLKMPPPPADLSPAAKKRLAHARNAAGQTAANEAALPPADQHVAEAQAAVTHPPEETKGEVEQAVVEALGERPKPSPEIEKLCEKIYQVIRDKRPPDEDKLVEAKPEEMGQAAGDAMKDNVQGDISKVDKSYNDLGQKPPATPGPKGADIPPEPNAAAAPGINAAQATPDAIPAKDVSLQADAADSAQSMQQAGMTTAPAQLVQEGPVADARGAQGDLEKVAAEDPAKVLADQKTSLAKAGADMAALQKSALQALIASRSTTTKSAGKQQTKFVETEEQTRARLSKQANDYYKEAQDRVNEQLGPLSKTAMTNWDEGVKLASTKFKQHLKKVEKWIDERHSGFGGGLVSLWDDWTGLPGWVTDEYDAAEQAFGDEVCALARKISADVNGVIALCEGIIATARKKINDLFTKDLPDGLKAWAETQKASFGKQLDGLSQHAHKVRDDFNKELVNKAAQAVQDVREQVADLREKAKGILGKIADAIASFIKDPVKTIINGLLSILGIPKAAFWAMVEKIKKVIGQIADDPLGFASNLMKAVGMGFSLFFDHILTHLIEGFLDWFTGGLVSAGVELPKDFSIPSIITFFLQLMGITWPRIRKLLAKHIGEQNVELIEKAWGMISTLIAMGPKGIFDWIREKLDPKNIVDMVIKAAVDYMTTAVIKAVTARILLLFNPVGAILQAIEAIYRVLRWIFVNAARIFKLVETVVNGIADILAGNFGGMAKAVEKALASLIAPVIDFLADYLGFGDLPNKVRDTIISFQNFVEGILDKAIGWLVTKAKGLLGIGKKEEGKPEEDADKGEYIYEYQEGGHTIKVRSDLEVFQFSKSTVLQGSAKQKAEQKALESVRPKVLPKYPPDGEGRALGPEGDVKGIKDGDRDTLHADMRGYQGEDQRGHLIGDHFFGEGCAENLVPMHPSLNLSTFRRYEKSLEKAYKEAMKKNEGVLLHMHIIPVYPSKDPDDPDAHFRPTNVLAESKVITLKRNAGKKEPKEEPFNEKWSNPGYEIPAIPINNAAATDKTVLRSLGLRWKQVDAIIEKRGEGRFKDDADFAKRLSGFSVPKKLRSKFQY